MSRRMCCSQSAVVRIYQQCQERQTTSWRQDVCHPRLTDAQGQQMSCSGPVWSKPKSLLWHVTQNVNDGYGRNVSQNTMLLMWLRSCRPIRNAYDDPCPPSKASKMGTQMLEPYLEALAVWAMFGWESLGPVIPMDVNLTCATYLNRSQTPDLNLN